MVNKLEIKGLEVGSVFNEAACAVVESTVRQTKTKKDYLTITVTDGTSQISGNIWNWNGPAIEKNTVVTIDGSITEWSGKKQLNVSKIVPTDEFTIVDFAPSGNFNIDDYWDEAMSMIDSIEDTGLQVLTRRIYLDYESKLRVAPGAKTIHNAYAGGCLEHSVHVARNAIAIARLYHVDLDLVIAGALLHDIGKVYEYSIDGTAIETTITGELIYHIPLGAIILDRYKNIHVPNYGQVKSINILIHIILSHHGALEYGSPVLPKCMEAIIVHIADLTDAKLTTAKEAVDGVTAPITDKIWAAGNVRMVTPTYIEAMKGGSLKDVK